VSVRGYSFEDTSFLKEQSMRISTFRASLPSVTVLMITSVACVMGQGQAPSPTCWIDDIDNIGDCQPPAGEPPACNAIRVPVAGPTRCYAVEESIAGYGATTSYNLVCRWILVFENAQGECVDAYGPFDGSGITGCKEPSGPANCEAS
jgi:hypothetical protein